MTRNTPSTPTRALVESSQPNRRDDAPAGIRVGVHAACKRFGDARALEDVTLVVEPGRFAVLLGPSGCGKTTLLRVVAGLERPDTGRVTLAGRDVTHAPAEERGIGFVFQDHVLFPHLDVAANVAFGLEARAASRASERRTWRDRIPFLAARAAKRMHAERIREVLALVGLEGYEKRRVHELSGGERQRVALARALAPGPRVLLMDEPLASLDRNLRDDLRREIRRLHARLGLTTLFVTHDRDEALSLADEVHLMHRGRIVESGEPRAVYGRPCTAFAARFLAAANVLDVTEEAGGTRLRTVLGILPPDVPFDEPRDGPRIERRDEPRGASVEPSSDAPTKTRRLHVLLPQDAVRLGEGDVTARVEDVLFEGPRTRVLLEAEGARFEAETRAEEAPRVGAHVRVAADWGRARVVRGAGVEE